MFHYPAIHLKLQEHAQRNHRNEVGFVYYKASGHTHAQVSKTPTQCTHIHVLGENLYTITSKQFWGNLFKV